MKRRRAELFIGVTSYNSSLFLPVCLRAVRERTVNAGYRLVVVDNASEDSSASLARQLGAEVHVKRCSQPDALNFLVALSDAPYTLLVHADVVLLDARWVDLCKSKLDATCRLVSPEDIGCGPFSRPFGRGMPESSFLFGATRDFRKTRIWKCRRWHRLPVPRRVIDFYGSHVTHRLPQRLKERGFSWFPMNVHISDRVAAPFYEPGFVPKTWSEELPYLRYGLGNFYSIDGVITHYHNWYERVDLNVDMSSTRTTCRDGSGFPLAYIKAYTEAFLADYRAHKVRVPPADKPDREPKSL